MKVAIFSDIHGNREALISIIKDIKKEGIKKIICLGDTIGIGPNPKECMDIIVDNNIKMVLGNHELYFIKGTQIDDEMGDGEIKHQNWIKNKITDRQKQYLEKCNMTYEIDCNGKKVVCEHFLIDYNSNDQYPFHDLKIAKDGSINEIIKPLNYDLIFIGHEHNVFTVDNKLYDVGSSGCRKDNTTQYTIFDTETFTVETKSLEYDRTNFEQDLLKENYPDRNLIAKCFFGIEL